MAKEEEAKDDAEAKGGGKKKLIIIIVPIVLLLAGAGWFMFLKPKDDSGVPKALPHPTAGTPVVMDSITVNLAGGAHFLKFGMALQPTADAHETDGSKAIDLAINMFSQKTLDELQTAKGKHEAKEELVARIKLTYVPHGTVLSEVTSTAATVEEQAKEEEKVTAEHKAEEGKAETEADAEHDEIEVSELTAAEAIKRAKSLTVQAEIYDVYFTEFVMQ